MNSEPGWTKNNYKYYALGLLVVVYIFNFIDRSILSILNQSIKDELGVSDTAMGFLGGIAFATFYTFVGIPLARLADRGVRRNVLTVCLALWSLMTAISGLVFNFWQLLLARIGVAVGEAGGSPPSHSMISDLFPANQRATALSVYSLGIPIGSMIGYLVGGRINEMFDWRTAFLLVGLPGLALAVLVRFTLQEPPRGEAEGLKMKSGEPPPVAEVFRYLWRLKSFKFLSLGAALHAFVGYGVSYWIPPMFYRSHGLGSMAMGQALFLLGFAGIASTFLGGYLADKLARFDQRWYVWLPGIATLVSIPFAAFTYLWHDATTALWVYSIPYLLGSFYLGPTFSLTQGLVGLRMRALAASILLFVLNLIGLGLGPQFTGIASDLLSHYTNLGSESLRWALVSTLAFNLASTVCYLLAAPSLRQDLANSHEMS